MTKVKAHKRRKTAKKQPKQPSALEDFMVAVALFVLMMGAIWVYNSAIAYAAL